jgi:hypothetical protein
MTATTPRTPAGKTSAECPAPSPATKFPTTPELPESRTVEQRLLAVDTLLADPEAIPDPLEVELYAYREQITGEIVG